MERLSSAGSSIRRRSFSISSHQLQIDNDAESESVSEAGDIGDRALPSRRYSESGSFHLSFEITPEYGGVVSGQDQQQYPAFSHSNSSVRPLPPQFTSPFSTDAIIVCSQDTDTKQDPGKGFTEWLDYVSCLIHLAVFGILGVMTRYLLQKLFGPGVAHVTSDQSILYLDLPSNMVGSFLMGWFGVVFKADVVHVSEHIAIGITTGYLGSLTTFSGWNQKMLELSASGRWLFAVLGYLIGMFLVAFSIIFGIETAKGFKWLLRKLNVSFNWRVDSTYRRQLVAMMMFLATLGILWGVCGALVREKFKHGGSAAQLWFACMVGPVGVWVRWFLARLNGRGLGSSELFKWIPFGTLIANVSSDCIMAALATVKKAVHTKDCATAVSGIQFGFLGCLSTVSTFAAEFNAMRESKHPWRAYAYALITICVSYAFGILIYCIPVWTKAV